MLLPHVALELQFVGDSLPPESDQQHFTMQRVRARELDPSPVLSLVGPSPSPPPSSALPGAPSLPLPGLPVAFPPHSRPHRMAMRCLCVLILGHRQGSALGLRRREGEGTCKSGCPRGPITCSRDPSLTWLLVRAWGSRAGIWGKEKDTMATSAILSR